MIYEYEEVTSMHWKIYLDIMEIKPEDYDAVFDIIEVRAVEPWFMGIRLLMARYATEGAAQATVDDLEPYCTVVEIEQVKA